MGKLNNEDVIFPEWIFSELKDSIVQRRAQKVFQLKLSESEAKLYHDHLVDERRTEDRLLTDKRVKPLWKRFYSLIDKNGLKLATDFLIFAHLAKLDALDMSLSKEEQDEIKSSKAKLMRQIKKLIETANGIDMFCSEMETKKFVSRKELDGENSYENQILKIKNDLLNQLSFYKRNTGLRVGLFIKDKSALAETFSTKKEGTLILKRGS